MSGLDFLVVVVGLLAGYWLVAFLMGYKRNSIPPAAENPKEGPNPFRDPQPGENTNTWHEVLGIASGASIDEIRQAYKRLISQYHPDKVDSLGPDLKALATRKTAEINTAYKAALVARGAAE